MSPGVMLRRLPTALAVTVVASVLLMGAVAAPNAAAMQLSNGTTSASAVVVSTTAAMTSIDVTIRNSGSRPLSVSAADFALSAEGDIYGAQSWIPQPSAIAVAPNAARVFPVSFQVPSAVLPLTTLSYRYEPILSLAPRVPWQASLGSSRTVNTYFTGGVGTPWGTVFDAAGNLWFALPGCDFVPTCGPKPPTGQIGELQARTHQVVRYTLPKITGNNPIFLTFDASGNLWYTTPDNSKIGEFSPSVHRFIGQWSVTAGSGPWDITFAGGALWYTEHLGSAVGRFDPVRHTHQDFTTPSANSNPYGIAASGSLIWFTENNPNVDRVAVLDTSKSNAISEYPIIQPLNGLPHMISVDPTTGDPWWTEAFANTIVTLNPSRATPGKCGTTSGLCKGISRWKVPPAYTCSKTAAHTSGISFRSSTGLVWFDNSLTAQVGSFNPTSRAFSMTTLSNCNAHPHDGLTLDSTGNVWFDEEFGGAIGELIP